jgi:hypothetical protein
MKLSIVIKSREDFDIILPLCEQIDKIQKEGKYLFYRFLCLCHQQNHAAFQKCMKKNNINVPYTFFETDVENSKKGVSSLIEKLDDDIFRNPIDSLLLVGWDESNQEITELAQKYLIKVFLLETRALNDVINVHYDYIFSTVDSGCWNNIIDTIKKIYQL